jgi:flagellar motor protein MotB
MFRLPPHFALLPILLLVGCNQNPFSTAGKGPSWNRSAPERPAHVTQLEELDRRNQSLDTDNRSLQRRVGQIEQERQSLQKLLQTRTQLLEETTADLESALVDKDKAKQEMEGLYASTKFRGGASIRANSSLTDQLTLTDIPGAKVEQDNGVVRIQIPADELFHPGMMQLQSGAPNIMADIAAAIRRNYPRQIISIECHTDNSPPRVGKTLHQLSVSQALTIHDEMLVKHRLPERQFLVTGYGGIAPLVSNATPAGKNKNRRVDIVIHPDTFGP